MRAPRQIAFTLLAATLGLVALEAGARLIEGAHPPRPLPTLDASDCMPDCLPGAAAIPVRGAEGLPGLRMGRHETRGWALTPGAAARDVQIVVRVNQRGLRGPDLPARPAPGERRLMTLGDSSVYGFGVSEDETYGAVAARALTRRSKRVVRPVNGGVPGYTSAQSLDLLREVGAAVDPDWVVIANLWSDLFHRDDPLPTERAPHPLALYRLALRGLAPYLPPPTVGWLDLTEGAGTPAPGRTPRTELDAYLDRLLALAEEAARLDALPVFLILPAPVDLDPEGAPAFVLAYRAAMVEAARRAGAPLVDGPAAFRAEGATDADFFDHVHPSIDGHGRLGAALSDALSHPR
jgi:lysophospholipase L1-like esterase